MRGLRIAYCCGALTASVLAARCGYESPAGPGYPPAGGPPALATVRLSLTANPIEVGQVGSAKATALDQYGTPIGAGPATYTSSSPEVAVVQPSTGAILAIAPGTTQITATIDGTAGQQTLKVLTPLVSINEVVPNGGAPGSWIELFNPTDAAVDVSSWVVATTGARQLLSLPEGTTIAAHGYFVVDGTSVSPELRLRTADAIQLFTRFGVQADSFTWTVDPGTSYGRCPDGVGALAITSAATRGSANACSM